MGIDSADSLPHQGGVLFRALRQAEIDAGFVLIPKSQESFLAHPRLPNVLPVKLGLLEEHAVREHQWNGQFDTRGISTTPHYERALHYAQRSRVIVRIDVNVLGRLGVRQYRVADCLPERLIEVPEDDEVVLVATSDGPLPAECVADVIRV